MEFKLSYELRGHQGPVRQMRMGLHPKSSANILFGIRKDGLWMYMHVFSDVGYVCVYVHVCARCIC
jgi:hypothetical protein